MPIRYSIVLPAYNEERSITRALEETHRYFLSLKAPFEMIVVDDGSQDRTATIVRRLERDYPELKLVRHPRNLGKGAAVKTGALKAEGSWVLFLDCDLSTQPSEFAGFLPELGNADVLIGSRRIKGARILTPQPWYRVQAGRFFNLIVRWYLRIPYRDTQCGFKAFRSTVLPIFRDQASTGWAFDVELLIRARQAGFRVKEVPVAWRHGSESRVRLRDAWKIFQEIRNLRRLEATGR